MEECRLVEALLWANVNAQFLFKARCFSGVSWGSPRGKCPCKRRIEFVFHAAARLSPTFKSFSGPWIIRCHGRKTVMEGLSAQMGGQASKGSWSAVYTANYIFE